MLPSRTPFTLATMGNSVAGARPSFDAVARSRINIWRMRSTDVLGERHSAGTSRRRITENTGLKASDVEDRAIPSSPRRTSCMSKKGRAILFATNMAVRLALLSCKTDFGIASTSNIVMAIAKVRKTAAPKAAAPMIAMRAAKPSSSPGSIPAPSLEPKANSNTVIGSDAVKTRPTRAPMTRVGATTPVGVGSATANTVVTQCTTRQSSNVPD
mmetsp:Transcript_86437/g.241871  ORF Transcript_86437/g.241871 Transcript_86437/m.241871 type:complete len:213 (-) Transcript_86437:1411-2049(-)